MKRKVSGGIEVRKASFKPATYDAEKRTVELVWSTGSQVRRSTWAGDFIEELSMQRKHVRLDRLNNGAPLLDSHKSWNLRDIIGVVESAKIVKGEGVATVRFSEREEVSDIIRDIEAGVIRNVSVGYRVHKFEKREGKEGELDTYRATDWEPTEISFVPVGADDAAQSRSEAPADHHIEIDDGEERSEETSENDTPETDDSKDSGTSARSATSEDESDEDKSRNNEEGTMTPEEKKRLADEAVKAERERASEIRKVAGSVGIDSQRADEWVDGGKSVEEVRKLVIEELAAKDKETDTRSQNEATIESGAEELDHLRDGCLEALMHRHNPAKNELTDKGRRYRGMSLIDMAAHSMRLRGADLVGVPRHKIIDQIRSGGSAAHSTSDFPLILENVLNKTLRDSYEAAPQTFQPFVRMVEVSDFKQISRTQLGDVSDLELLGEGGEIKEGTIGEAAEKYEVDTYARKVSITRKALVNDDLSAFTRLPELFGRAARDKESDLVWGIITANAAMGDGNALFSSAHSNLAGSGGAISVTTLGAAREAMRKQTGLNGRLINVMAEYLVVPASLETVADQFVSQSLLANQSNQVNPFAGRLQVIAEPRLDSDSATAWYTMASAGAIDMIEMARLTGESGPVIESMDLFDVEGIKVKARMDVGVKAIDWRGMYKDPGA